MSLSKIILHPIFLGALALLLLNDFILKIHHPSFISGKLSDLAGLIVLPVFVYSIFLSAFSTEVKKAGLLLAVALLFGALQSENFLGYANQLLHSLSLPSHNLTADLSDLWTLPALAGALWFLMYFEKTQPRSSAKEGAGVWTRLVFGLSLFALIATSFTGTNTLAVNDPLSHQSNRELVIKALHQELVNSGFKVTRNTIIKDSTQLIEFELKTEPTPPAHLSEYYRAELYLEKNTAADSIIVAQFKMYQLNREISDELIDSVFINQIRPVIKRVQAKYR